MGNTEQGGNIHVHLQDDSAKYYYDVVNQRFYDESHVLAPKVVQNLLRNEEFTTKLIHGLEILGYQ